MKTWSSSCSQDVIHLLFLQKASLSKIQEDLHKYLLYLPHHEFPEQSFIGGTSISRASDSSFNLFDAGIYLVIFETTVANSAQLVLTLNGTELSYTVSGRDAGGSQITGMAIIAANEGDVLTLRNPVSAASSLTLTPNPGGNSPWSANLIIIRLKEFITLTVLVLEEIILNQKILKELVLN